MNNAIVVVYEGVTPSTEFIQRLGSTVSETFAFGGGDVSVIVLDKESIAKAVLKRAVDSAHIAVEEIGERVVDTVTAIENAVTFFREKFAEEISTQNGIAFTLCFSSMLSDAKARKAFNPGNVSNEDEAVINATEIVCKYANEIVSKRKLPKGIVNAIVFIASKV